MRRLLAVAVAAALAASAAVFVLSPLPSTSQPIHSGQNSIFFEINMDNKYKNIILNISYIFIDNWDVIKEKWPSIANRLNESVPSAVLKLSVVLVNGGGETIYYATVPGCSSELWRVNEPLTLPVLSAEEGFVLLPRNVSCLLALLYREIPPGSGVSNEFTYLVTKDFKGYLKIITNICLKQEENLCKIIEKTVEVGGVTV